MDLKSTLRALIDMPLDGEDFARVMEMIAAKIKEWRTSHNGYVPLSIFKQCLSIGGVYPCVEILPCVGKEGDARRFALKKRSAAEGEQDWNGLWTIPGVAVRTTDNQQTIFDRLSKGN